MAILAFDNISFSYPEQQVCLQNIDLQIKQGEFVVLIGQSGCGKTTLLKQIKRELAPAGILDGTIRYNDQPLSELTAAQASAEIGYVLQNPENQIVTDFVWSELAFGLESLGIESAVIRRRVAEMAHYFGIQSWFHEKTAYLSGGQKQLLNLAATMVMQPKILLLDEPTAQLDPIAAAEFMETIGRLHEELGLTVVMIEHRLEEVLPKANRVVVLEKGRMIYNGAPRQLIQQLPQHPMIEALPAPLRIAAAVNTHGEIPLTIREGQQWLQQFPAQRVQDVKVPFDKTEVILQAKDVAFRYDKAGQDIVADFNVAIRKGEFYTIVGGNGSGKSTALNILAGLYKPQKGYVTLYGKKLNRYKTAQLYKMVTVMPQDPKVLFLEKTVRDELYRLPDVKVHKVDEMVQLLELNSLLVQHPYDLSGGEQQRLAFAKLLLREPQILLLDEPTKGLDAFAKAELGQLLKSLQQQGMTIVMVTHDIEFSARFSDRCALFFDKSIISEDAPRPFYSGNHFYTTAAYRMSRQQFEQAILVEDVVQLCKII